MSKKGNPVCPYCKQPLPDHARRAMAIEKASSLYMELMAEIDQERWLVIETQKAQRKAPLLGIIKDFQDAAKTPETLFKICEGLRAVFDVESPVREDWAEVGPELLAMLWQALERIGGPIPERPPIVTANPHGDDEYIQNVLDAINDVVGWCASRVTTDTLLESTKWSLARSPSDWLKVFKKLGYNCNSLSVFNRQRKDGVLRQHPDSKTKSVQLALESLPPTYSDDIRV